MAQLYSHFDGSAPGGADPAMLGWEPRGCPTPPPPSHRHPPRGAGSPTTAPPAPRSSGPPPPGLPARPIGGPDRGRSIRPTRPRRGHADPTMVPAAISLVPTAPALPRVSLRASCGARRCGHRSLGPSCRGPGVIAPGGGPGRRLPLVALMLQWRQNYPNNRPPTWATAISAVGHNLPPR
jgi:hypothetical protein